MTLDTRLMARLLDDLYPPRLPWPQLTVEQQYNLGRKVSYYGEREFMRKHNEVVSNLHYSLKDHYNAW